MPSLKTLAFAGARAVNAVRDENYQRGLAEEERAYRRQDRERQEAKSKWTSEYLRATSAGDDAAATNAFDNLMNAGVLAPQEAATVTEFERARKARPAQDAQSQIDRARTAGDFTAAGNLEWQNFEAIRGRKPTSEDLFSLSSITNREAEAFKAKGESAAADLDYKRSLAEENRAQADYYRTRPAPGAEKPPTVEKMLGVEMRLEKSARDEWDATYIETVGGLKAVRPGAPEKTTWVKARVAKKMKRAYGDAYQPEAEDLEPVIQGTREIRRGLGRDVVVGGPEPAPRQSLATPVPPQAAPPPPAAVPGPTTPGTLREVRVVDPQVQEIVADFDSPAVQNALRSGMAVDEVLRRMQVPPQLWEQVKAALPQQ